MPINEGCSQDAIGRWLSYEPDLKLLSSEKIHKAIDYLEERLCMRLQDSQEKEKLAIDQTWDDFVSNQERILK